MIVSRSTRAWPGDDSDPAKNGQQICGTRGFGIPSHRTFVAVVLAALLGGCEQSTRPSHFTTLAGRVKTCNPETGELAISTVRRTGQGEMPETEYCLITKDSEIYINERFAAIGLIQVGDEVSVFGYREQTPTLARFVITAAYFERPLPPPPDPLATRPTSAAAPTHPTSPPQDR